MSKVDQMMRGVVCEAGGACYSDAVPKPQAVTGQAVLRVRLAGICDTDLQLVRGYMGFRGVLGHEFVAETAGGQRVTAEINQPCWSCEVCERGAGEPGVGWHRHCPNRSVIGILNHDGAMAEFVVVDERTLHSIPDSIDDRTAVFIEPLAAALHVLECLEVGRHRRCAVLGDGKLGLLCAWVLRDAGFETTLIGKHREKLALAGDGVETLLAGESPRDRRFDGVVDATGSESGLRLALDLVRPMGIVILKTTVAAQHSLELAPLVIHEVRVVGSRCGAFAPAIEALDSGRFDVARLIEGEYPLERASEAFGAAGRPGARKVLLRP